MSLIDLHAGPYAAVVSSVGGALARLDHGGRPLVLDTVATVQAATPPMPPFSGAVLAPWPNRIRDGRYRYDGVVHQLPITEVERGCALHGLLVWAGWDVVACTGISVRLATTVWPQPGYPFTIGVIVEYRLRDDGLHVEITAHNRGQVRAPFGASLHPYLVPGVTDGLMDDWTLTLPTSSVMDVEPKRLLPRRLLPVDGTAIDFRASRRLTGVELDHAFDAPGAGHATLTGPDGFGTQVQWDDRHRWLQVCTLDAAPEPWRRSGLAVEPMTCPPDAFNSGTDLWMLAPDERRGCGMTIAALVPPSGEGRSGNAAATGRTA